QTGMALMRLNANGTLDTTFGTNGQVNTPIPTGGTSYYVPDIAVTSGGQILALGQDRTNFDVLLARYHRNGSLDTTFGNGAGNLAISEPKFASPADFGEAVAIQSDGKIVLAGSASGYDVASTYSQVGRLNVDGSMGPTFGNGGLVLSSTYT